MRAWRELNDIRDQEIPQQIPSRTPSYDLDQMRAYIGQTSPERQVAEDIGRAAPTVLSSQDLMQAVQLQTPLERVTGESFFQRSLEFAGTAAKEIARSMYFWEDDISGRERAYRMANVASLAIPAAWITKAGVIARAFPAVGALAASARGRLVLSALSEASVAGAVEAIREPEERGEHGIALAVTVGGVLGVAGQKIGDAIAASARRKVSKPLAEQFMSVQAHAGPNSPFEVGTYAILRTSHKAAPDAINAAATQDILRQVSENGFYPVRVRTHDAQDAVLIPGLRERDAIALGKELKLDEIITDRGLLDLRNELVHPLDMQATRWGSQVIADVDHWLDLPTDGGPLRVALGFDVQNPLTLGKKMPAKAANAMEKMRQHIDDGAVHKSFWQNFQNLDMRTVLPNLYSKVVRGHYGARLFDAAFSPKLARGTEQQFVRDEILGVDESLEKTIQLGRAAWSGWAEVAIRSDVRAWDKPLQSTGHKGLMGILEQLPVSEMDEFQLFGFAMRQKGEQALGLPTPLSAKEVAEIVDNAPKHWFKALKEITQWRNRVVYETLVKNGVMSKRRFAQMLRQYPYYVPQTLQAEAKRLARAENFADALAVFDPIRTTIQQGDLSKIKYVPWVEELMTQTAMMSRIASQQQAINRMLKIATGHPQVAANFLEAAPSIAAKGLTYVDPKGNTFVRRMVEVTDPVTKVKRDVGEWWRIKDQMLWDSISQLSPEQTATIVRIAGKFSALQRVGVTSAFEFVGKNPIRDSLFAFVTAGVNPMAFLHGATTLIKSHLGDAAASRMVDDFLVSGAARAALVSVDRDHMRNVFRATMQAANQPTGVAPAAKGVLKGVFLHPLDAMIGLSEFMENTTRIGSFRQRTNRILNKAAAEMRKVDMTAVLKEAALYSREASVDFGVHGANSWMSNLRIASAFFNAGIQGGDQFLRSIKRDPMGVAKRMSLLTGISMMMYAKNRQDPEYKNLPDWERMLFWHVKREGTWGQLLGDDQQDPTDDLWMRIPKPFEPGIIAGSLVERFLESIDEKDPKMLDEGIAQMLADVSGSYLPIPTVFQPVAENLIGRSRMTGAPIVPEGLKDTDPDFHRTPATSEFAIGLARMLNRGVVDPEEKISPLEIDNLVRGWTGGIGTMVVHDAGDIIVERSKKIRGEVVAVKPERERLATLPFTRGFVSAYPSGAQPVEDAYKIARQARIQARTFEDVARGMEVDDALDYLKSHMELISLDKDLQGMITQIGELRNLRQEVYDMPGMSAQDKRRTIRQLDDQMVMFAQSLLQIVEAAGVRPSELSRSMTGPVRRMLSAPR